MTTAAQALAGLAQQSPATQLAPLAAAQQPNPFMAAISRPEIYMALMGGGLSALGSGDVGQGFQTGMGTYQQLLQNQMAEKDREAQAAESAAMTDYRETQLDQGQQRIDLEREKIAAAEKAAKIKAAAEAEKDKAPKGVDEKLWGRAFDTVVGAVPAGEDVDIMKVYDTYNSMVGEDQKAYPTFGRAEMKEYLNIMESRPEYAGDYLESVHRYYGDTAFKRMSAVWDKASTQLVKDAESGKGEDEDEPLIPESIKRVSAGTAPAGQPASPIAPFFNPMQALGTVQNYFTPDNLYKNYPFTTLGR